jgi:hypothetical protein
MPVDVHVQERRRRPARAQQSDHRLDRRGARERIRLDEPDANVRVGGLHRGHVGGDAIGRGLEGGAVAHSCPARDPRLVHRNVLQRAARVLDGLDGVEGRADRGVHPAPVRRAPELLHRPDLERRVDAQRSERAEGVHAHERVVVVRPDDLGPPRFRVLLIELEDPDDVARAGPLLGTLEEPLEVERPRSRREPDAVGHRRLGCCRRGREEPTEDRRCQPCPDSHE